MNYLIVHVINHMHQGGAQKITYNIVNNIRERYDVVLIAKKGIYLNKLKSLRGVKVIERNKLLFLIVLNLIKKSQKLYNKIIIHTHNRKDILVKVLCPKNVIHLHTFHSAYPNKNFLYKFIKPKNSISISKTVQDYLEKFNIKSKIIYNGVDTASFKHSRIKKQTKQGLALNIWFLGRLSKEKGILQLIEAYDPKKMSDLILNIIGEGELLNSCKSNIAKKNLNSRIIFHGQLENPWDIVDDGIIVIPSHFEGFCLVALEAIINGRPFICSDIPVIRELCYFLPEECFFNPFNSKSLKRAILWGSENRDKILAAVQLASFEYEKKFSIKNMTDQYNKLYEDLLKSNSL